jgi:pantoate--beta-alanine ligase
VPTLLREPQALRDACDAARARGLRVGFVPTMGALHRGHLALVDEARRRATFVVVSIFVNPTQFGPGEDLDKYPRDLPADLAKLSAADAVFAPDAGAMYAPGDQTRVRVGAVAEPLCGKFRPGHFEGVATVVTKLFALTGPCVAVFGEKDYQQLAVLRRVALDLFLPVEIVGHAIVREPDGLAMSSRNAYLSASERERALALSRGLDAASRLFAGGERAAGRLRAAILEQVTPAATSVDYVDVVDPDTLQPWSDGERTSDRAVAAIACRIGATRLIDNRLLASPVAAALDG